MHQFLGKIRQHMPRFTVMQILTASGLICMIAFGLVDALLANDTGHEHRVRHYDTVAPESVERARYQFQTDMRRVEETLKRPHLGAQNLEQIHEITYSMESSLKTLSSKWGDKQFFPEVTASLELLHKASEDHREAETRAYFTSLSKKSEQLFTAVE